MLQITAEAADHAMTWPALVSALRDGHQRGRPTLDDMFVGVSGNGMLVRAAVIAGLGRCVKAMTIVAENATLMPPLPTIHGEVIVFDDATGVVRATIDGVAVTRWKTAGDSALGAELLARPDVENLLMVGAGTMAEPLIRAHCAVRPSLRRITIWNRSRDRAAILAKRLGDLQRTVVVADDLDRAVSEADVVSVATMSSDPIIRGARLKPGAHLDLVGAYTPDMREADDEAMRRGRVYVDFRGTTIGHIGELMIPIRSGVISEADVLGDLYDLVTQTTRPRGADDVTVYKNGGGAHLDLMTARSIIAAIAG